MAAHARLKNEFTKDEKCHNLMKWLNFELTLLLCHCLGSENFLTVAYPHIVLVLCSIDSIMSTPISRRYGSLVARYKYIAASTSSVAEEKTLG